MTDRKHAPVPNCTDDGGKKCCSNARKYAGAEQTRSPACTESRTEDDRDGEPSRDKGPRIKIAWRHEPVESSPDNERTAQQSGPQPVLAKSKSGNLTDIPAICPSLTALRMNVFPVFLEQIARDCLAVP